MSYILDALKKSEQERRSRKRRGLLKEPFEVPDAFSPPSGTSRRWPIFVAIILFLNICFFAFWLRPRGDNANGPRDRIPASQITEANPQPTPATESAHLAQGDEKKKAAESPAGEKKRSALNTPQSQGAAPGPKAEPGSLNRPPASPAPTVPDAGRPAETMVKKPESPKPHPNEKAAGPQKDFRTANPDMTRKNPPEPPAAEQPRRQAVTSGIISDIQPLAELSPPPGKPEAQHVQKWQELSAPIRDAIPNLSVSMLIYSEKPEERWININGSKRREGDTISAGLQLDEITPDGAIFSFQGHRFYKGVVGD